MTSQAAAPVSRQRRSRTRRRFLGLFLTSLVIGLSSLLSASGAQAVPGVSDCKTAPTPELPGRGVVGCIPFEIWWRSVS